MEWQPYIPTVYENSFDAERRLALQPARRARIKPLHENSFDAERRLAGRLIKRQGLSPRRIRYAHSVLSSALKKAVELDVLPRNVAKFVQLPKQIRKEMDVLNESEVAQFFEALKDERFKNLFRFALGTGMRNQEYTAVQWKDLDFERKTVVVQRAIVWQRTGGGWHFKEPKTAKSRRTIPLPSEIIIDLKRHRIEQLEQRMRLGEAWTDHDLIFTSEIGTPLNPANITRAFKRILHKANLRTTLRLYDLRHTHATLLMKSGVNPKVVQERLGHSSVTLTLDIYSHVLPTMQQDATEKLESLIFNKTGTFQIFGTHLAHKQEKGIQVDALNY